MEVVDVVSLLVMCTVVLWKVLGLAKTAILRRLCIELLFVNLR